MYSFKKYYIEHYANSSVANKAALTNSKILKGKSQELYLMNELSRAQLFSISGNSKKAFTLLFDLKKNKRLKKNKKLYGYYLNVYGGLLFDSKKYSQARFYHKKALALLTECKDSVGMKGNLINIGNVFTEERKLDSAIVYYNRASVLQALGIEEFSEALKTNLSVFYTFSNEFEKAIEMQESIINTLGKKGDYYGEIIVSFNLVEALMKLKNYSKAIEILKKINRLSEKYHMNYYLESSFHTLSDCYKEIGDFQNSNLYLHKAFLIVKNKNKTQLAEFSDKLKFKYKAELYKKEKKIRDQQIRQERFQLLFLTVILCFTAVLVVILIRFIRNINRKNLLLAAKNLELTQLFSTNKKERGENKSVLPELIEKFEKLFDKDKVYVDPDLSIERLAKLLKTNRTYLSETINLHYNESFRTIVNMYRINEARLLLVDSRYSHYSIEGIARTVGYNSISSFNTIFKKETGITPSYFRNHYLSIMKEKAL